MEKLVELNVTASRAALTEAAQHTQAVLSVKDAQELLTLQAGLFQPLAEKTASYSRHLYDIASNTAGEFNKALEVQSTEARKSFNSLLDNSTKNAPAGSESAVAMVKSAVSAANNAFESVQKRSSKPPTWPKPISTRLPRQQPKLSRPLPLPSVKHMVIGMLGKDLGFTL